MYAALPTQLDAWLYARVGAGGGVFGGRGRVFGFPGGGCHAIWWSAVAARSTNRLLLEGDLGATPDIP